MVKIYLVDFRAIWCKPCHEIKPRLDKLRSELGGKGFEVLSVSIDERRPDLVKYLAKTKFANPVLHDANQTWAAWKVKAIPAMFLVKDGQIVHQWIGKPKKDDLENVVRAAIK
jgi:thioredoxin-like negative regulator of GroEL